MEIADELNRLSRKERENVEHDIHGVADFVDEIPELVERALAELDTHLNEEGSKQNSEAYKLAESQSPEYVKDRKIRLKFLRADRFDAEKAADRMFRFYEQKMILFGPQKLCKYITLDDMNSADMECIENSHMQLLPSRDQAGRTILVMALSFMKYVKPENQLRNTYYMFMSALEDEETQKKGFVLVTYRIGAGPALDDNLTATAYTLLSTLPLQIQGWHLCTASTPFSQYFVSMKKFMEKRARLRSRVHFGTHTECTYALMTFGIPIKHFPITDGRSLNIKRHQEWIATRRKLESEEGHLICIPSRGDVLFGRGRPFQDHPGNLRLNLILESKLPEYNSSKKMHKRKLASEIVETIKSAGGRFLKPVGAMWEEVDDETANEKVLHTFRSIRSTSNTKKSGENRRKLDSLDSVSNPNMIIDQNRTKNCCP